MCHILSIDTQFQPHNPQPKLTVQPSTQMNRWQSDHLNVSRQCVNAPIKTIRTSCCPHKQKHRMFSVQRLDWSARTWRQQRKKMVFHILCICSLNLNWTRQVEIFGSIGKGNTSNYCRIGIRAECFAQDFDSKKLIPNLLKYINSAVRTESSRKQCVQVWFNLMSCIFWEDLINSTKRFFPFNFSGYSVFNSQLCSSCRYSNCIRRCLMPNHWQATLLEDAKKHIMKTISGVRFKSNFTHSNENRSWMILPLSFSQFLLLISRLHCAACEEMKMFYCLATSTKYCNPFQ